jgi:diphthine-ammonia ligase
MTIYSIYYIIDLFKSKMKVVALISGGKDSTYNMMQCVRNGHEIVALVNLKPPELINELDSFMYQSVGSEIIDLYGDAMNLPLYRHEINGKPLNSNLDYEETNDDEVEDLYKVLKNVKEDIKSKYNIEIDAVSSGM